MNRKKKRRAVRRERGESTDGMYGYANTNEDYIPEDMSGMSQKSGDKRSTESGAGMTAKGVAKYNSRTGGDLKTAVNHTSQQTESRFQGSR